MGNHRIPELIKLGNWFKKNYGKSDRTNLDEIYSALQGPDYVKKINGKRIYVDIVGNDDWRQIAGKVVCFAFNAQKRKEKYEIWIVTDFNAHKDIKRLNGKKKIERIKERKEWINEKFKDILMKTLKHSINVKFKYFENNSKKLIEI